MLQVSSKGVINETSGRGGHGAITSALGRRHMVFTFFINRGDDSCFFLFFIS